MPAIWNVNNTYNVNSSSNKKIASKITFDVGEKFSGKIIKKGSGNEVSIKLTDGWEFTAEIEGDLDSLEKGFQRFEVEGFKDGKLKLKLINKCNESNLPNKGELGDIITKEGLSKKDIPILEAMLKYEIPLTKENIKMVKGLIQFNEKIQGNPKEVEAFIAKYLESKGIDSSSIKGQEVTQKLEQFFNAFKNLSKEDVLLFLENNIEFTKENVESYNKIFKEDMKVSNVINKINNELEDLNLLKNTDENIASNKGEVINNKISEGKEMNSVKVVEGDNVEIELSDNTGQALKIKTEDVKNSDNKLENINSKLATDTYGKNNVSQNKVSMLEVLKSLIGKGEEQLNASLKDIINNNKVEFTVKELESAYNIINKMDDDSFISILKKSLNETNGINETSGINDNKKIEEVKITLGEKTFSKSDIENVLSKIVGKELTLTEEEFSNLKDVINSKITETENNKTSNVKVSQNEVAVNKETQALEDKGEEVNKTAVSLKGDSAENLKTLVKEKVSTQEIVKNNISTKGEEGKEVIKNILSKLKSEVANPEKILDVIKNSINDIKLFNKITQEYYYLDVPVNIKEKEYPCKLILKDNRKDGKKIDSTNVKMVVTVKTGNIGVVDGYIKVLEKRIDIDLKCEESFVKIVDLGKEKLVSNIKELGFNISVKVSKKENEVSLTNCREFFNENNRANIDIKV